MCMSSHLHHALHDVCGWVDEDDACSESFLAMSFRVLVQVPRFAPWQKYGPG